MEISSTVITCDGCGLPASPEHVAGRLERLDLATRFRPIHINVLFVASHPMVRNEDDFYRAPVSQEFFTCFMDALDIPVSVEKLQTSVGEAEIGNASLIEFQRRGYYLAYLSECPLAQLSDTPHAGDDRAGSDSISRLAPTLITRIRFNYKPKHVVLLETNLYPLYPLIGILGQAGLGSQLLLDHDKPLAVPKPGDAGSLGRFREVLAGHIPRAKSFSGV
jgi:hypothetical protein